MADKHLHEYDYDEIKRWMKSEYPSAQGRSWRRAVRETVYRGAMTCLSTGLGGLLDWVIALGRGRNTGAAQRWMRAMVQGIAGALQLLPPCESMVPVLLSGAVMMGAPLMAQAMIGSGPVTTGAPDIEAMLRPIMTVVQSIGGIVATGVNLGMAVSLFVHGD